jgi:hypothetical protein
MTMAATSKPPAATVQPPADTSAAPAEGDSSGAARTESDECQDDPSDHSDGSGGGAVGRLRISSANNNSQQYELRLGTGTVGGVHLERLYIAGFKEYECTQHLQNMWISTFAPEMEVSNARPWHLGCS